VALLVKKGEKGSERERERERKRIGGKKTFNARTFTWHIEKRSTANSIKAREISH